MAQKLLADACVESPRAAIERAYEGLYQCSYDADDGSLRFRIGGDVHAVEHRVVELLMRSRALLSDVDLALGRLIENAGSRRNAISCLVNCVRKIDANRPRYMATDVCAIREVEFAQGIDYVCDAFNSDGRTLPVIDRVRSMMIGAHVHGMNAEWVASLVKASDSDLAEALSSHSLEPEPLSGSAPCSDSSESYAPDAVVGSSTTEEAVTSAISRDVPVPVPAVAAAKFIWYDEPTYGWAQADEFVEIFVTDDRFKGVGALPREAVTCNFSEKSFDLKVLGLKGMNFRLCMPALEYNIISSESKLIIRKDRVKLQLKKSRKGDNWTSIKSAAPSLTSACKREPEGR